MTQQKREVGQETASGAVIVTGKEGKACRGLCYRCVKGNCIFWVSDLRWIPERKVKAARGMSGSAGVDRVMPAHFIITLHNFEGVEPETAVSMTRYLGWSAFKEQSTKAMPPFIIVKINHKDKNYLRKGMKIKISGYTVRGDEGGTWTYFARIDIMNRPALGETIQRYLEVNMESPNSGGRMFCAYELFGKDDRQRTQYIYLWVACMEYYVKDGALMSGAGVSLPVVLAAEGTPRGLMIKSHRKPVDGEGYGGSIRRMFPVKYHEAIFSGGREYDRRAKDLQRDTESQARDYYKLKR